MLKSYYCVTYNFKTRDDGRIIFLRLILYTENKNIHKCNSKLIIAISKEYDFIEYEMQYLSPAHLDTCSPEDKIHKYGYDYAFESSMIYIVLHHYHVDPKTEHMHFNFVRDTFNTLEEREILGNKVQNSFESLKAVEVVQRDRTIRAEYPVIYLDDLDCILSGQTTKK